MDGFPSGQRGQTVNLLQIASVVRIHLHPSAGVAELADAQDLKSCCSNTVPVRFRSPAVIERRGNIEFISVSSFCFSFGFFLLLRKQVPFLHLNNS